MNRRSGLPSGQVHASCQDAQGQIWLAGPSGLSCWDGAHLKVFNKAQGLRTQGLRSLALSPDGSLWIGSDLGVDRLDGQGQGAPQIMPRITPVTPDDWPYGWVSQLVFGARGVWLGCARGLVYWSPESGFVPQALNGESGALISALALDAAGRLWVASPLLGLLWQDGETFRKPAGTAWQRAGRISCLGLNGRGQLMAGGTDGLVTLDEWGGQAHTAADFSPRTTGPGEQTAHDSAPAEWQDQLPGLPITALLARPDELWVGSGSGLAHYRADGARWQLQNRLLPETTVNSLMLDRQDNLWVATDQAGMARVSGLRSALTAFVPGGSILTVRPAPPTQEPDGQAHAQGAHAQGASEQVWLGGVRGSWQLDLRSGQAAPLAGLEQMQVWDLLRHGGEVWAATQQGLYRQQAGRFELHAPEQAALSQPCRSLLARRSGLWVGTVHGLYELRPGQPPRELQGEGRSLGYVYTLTPDAQGRTLIGTLGRGLWQELPGPDGAEAASPASDPDSAQFRTTRDNTRWSSVPHNPYSASFRWSDQIHPQHGSDPKPSELLSLSSGPLLAGSHIYALAPHQDGRLVILQDHQTLLMDAAGAVRVLDQTGSGVAGWTALWRGDRLWVGSSSGLREYQPGPVPGAAPGKPTSSNPISSHSASSHPAPGDSLHREISAWLGPDAWEFTTSRSLLPLPGGRLLCGVNSGAVLLDPQRLAALPPLPPVQLSSLRWTGGQPDPSNELLLRIAAGSWSLEADFACPWFLDESDLLYRTRLLGFQRDWSPWSGETSLRFTALPPGEYTLEAQVYSRLLGRPPPGAAASRLLTFQVRTPAPAHRLARSWSQLVSARSDRRLLERTLQLEQSVRERTLEIERANGQLQRLNGELLALSSTDPLTGLANRRTFDEVLRREVQRAERHGTPLSVALIDVDEFKRYNDTLGHLQGDDCLRRVAQIVQGSVRGGLDLAARFGGEEFVLVLPDTTAAGAQHLLDRVRQLLAQAAIAHPGSRVAHWVTLSAGISSVYSDQADGPSAAARSLPDGVTLLSPDLLMHQADLALYQAKRQGRDRAVIYGQGEVAPPAGS